MRNTVVIASAVSAVALLLAACNQKPIAEPSSDATAAASEAIAASEEPSGDASEAAQSGLAAQLDQTALGERRDPERVLRYYINALRIGDWDDAAKAWTLDAQMTPNRLAEEFGGDAGPRIALGRGDTSTAAGSIYYEAPVVLDFADGRPARRGSIVLRRVNDVPGASEQQLNWRIERMSTVTR
jgi:TPR repeat protein